MYYEYTQIRAILIKVMKKSVTLTHSYFSTFHSLIHTQSPLPLPLSFPLSSYHSFQSKSRTIGRDQDVVKGQYIVNILQKPGKSRTSIFIRMYNTVYNNFPWLKILPVAHTMYSNKNVTEFNFANCASYPPGSSGWIFHEFFHTYV